jgi:hypothetical protein
MSAPPDALIARVWATPAGRDLLDHLAEPLAPAQIRAAIERERKRWSTGGPVRTLAKEAPMPETAYLISEGNRDRLMEGVRQLEGDSGLITAPPPLSKP